MATPTSHEPERRHFTVRQANQAVPRLRDRFATILTLRAQLRPLYTKLEEAGFPPNEEDDSSDGLDPSHLPAEVARDHAVFQAMVDSIRDQVDEIAAEGCMIKDLEAGLVDWPATHQGREILLCWRFGEAEVGFWHDLTSGFAGRRPISELPVAPEPC